MRQGHWHCLVILAVILALSVLDNSGFAHRYVFIAGPNGSVDDPDQGESISVVWNVDQSNWMWYTTVEHNQRFVVADQDARPAVGFFESPKTNPRDYDSLIPLNPGWQAPVTLGFKAAQDPPHTQSQPFAGWFAKILEPGWQWVLPSPGDTINPLVTADGQFYDWQFATDHDPLDPTTFSISFATLQPDVLLGLHLNLHWVGTPDNTIWGDKIKDDGTPYIFEGVVRTSNYPIIVPEPTTLTFTLIAALLVVLRRFATTQTLSKLC